LLTTLNKVQIQPLLSLAYMSLKSMQPVNTEDNTLSKYEAVTKAYHRLHCFL